MIATYNPLNIRKQDIEIGNEVCFEERKDVFVRNEIGNPVMECTRVYGKVVEIWGKFCTVTATRCVYESENEITREVAIDPKRTYRTSMNFAPSMNNDEVM